MMTSLVGGVFLVKLIRSFGWHSSSGPDVSINNVSCENKCIPLQKSLKDASSHGRLRL